MKRWAIAALLAGVLLAIGLALHFGVAEIAQAAGQVGWTGFALICIAGVGVEVILGGAWYVLMSVHRVSWHVLIFARQLRDSAGDILPLTPVGGMVVGARAAVLGGAPTPIAFAGMIVDVTTEFVGQIAFIALGLAIGIGQLRADSTMAPYASALVLTMALFTPAAIAFIALQRSSGRFAGKIAERLVPAALSHTESFTRALGAFYTMPARILLSSLVHLAAWIASGIWIWLVLRLIGANVDLASALAIESFAGALRSVTAFVPAHVGVQEAGYAMLAPVFGMGPEIGFAVSLLKRARDLVIGIPVLLAWQVIEGKRAFAQFEPQ
jgi:putative membrane protein